MENLIKRGQVRYAMLEPVLGSEQGGRRPVIVVSNDMGNRHGPTVVVVPVTTGPKPLLPTHVLVGGRAGLEAHSIALCEQVRTIDKRRLSAPLGKIGAKGMALISAALETELGLAQDAELIVLCPACADDFRNAGLFHVRRANPGEPACEYCTVCCTNRGFEYVLTRKRGE